MIKFTLLVHPDNKDKFLKNVFITKFDKILI